MRTITKNLLIITTLGVMATSAFSQVNNRNQERQARYQERYRDMDICVDIKRNLDTAEDAYLQFDDRIQNLTGKIQTQRRIVNQRVSTLEAKKNAFHNANSQVANLTQLKKDKPRLTEQNKQSLAAANAAIPSALQTYRLAKDEKKRKCKGLGWSKKCRRAKKARDKAENAYNNLKRQKTKAENMLTKLSRVETDLARVQNILITTQTTLRNEQAITPAISQLQTTLRQKMAKRNKIKGEFAQVEEEYGKLEVRLDKCQKMKYQVKRGKAFKKSLLIFAANNTQGCDRVRELLYNARNKAQKDGVNEAYDLVCESDVLVRVETAEVPVD